jgi:ADP-L-glycero-D-manno-heptose 6-epimerase
MYLMILVTGASGFIGSVLARDLNEIGKENLILSDLHPKDNHPNLKNIKYEKYLSAFDMWECPKDLDSLSCIFHMGACSSTTEMDKDYLKKVNSDYTKILFELATKLQIPFIYASSAATYGDGEKGYSDNHSEVSKFLPLNPYGQSKQDFDIWILQKQNVKETPPFWAGLKFFNVYGPNEYHKGEMRSLVHKAFGQIKETGKVKLFKSYKENFKDGEQLRDFIYVKDCSKAMIDMMSVNDSSKSGIYNLGTGAARSFVDLVKPVFAELGKETNIEFVDMPESIKNQYQYYTRAEMQKFETLLPHFQFSSIEDGVKDYVRNYLNKENPHY